MKLPALLGVATLLAVSVSAGAAHAQASGPHVRNAGDLAALCGANPRDPAGAARVNYCDGFAQGAVDVLFLHSGATKPFCIPAGTKREVTLHEFAGWVRAVPSRESTEATSTLFHFLAERYPCK
jgi:Rap1a immunity proteins